MKVVKKYWNYVYIYVLFLVPFLCMCAGALWTSWKILGWNTNASWTQIIIFDTTQVIYMMIGIFFIYKNKKDSTFIARRLKYVKAYVVLSLFLQYNFILYAFGSEYDWECVFIFFACVAFLFDSKIMVLNVFAYFIVNLVHHVLRPEMFFPAGDVNLNEIISWRLVVYWLTSLCMVLCVYYVERFMMQAWESKEENVHMVEKQLKYYEDMELLDAEIRKFRHDIQNHFICMEYLFENNKTEELQQYFVDLKETMNFQQRVYFSGNEIIDAILHYELPRNCHPEVDVTIYGDLPKIETVSSLDLCTIFSNLLSNAIRAANQCVETENAKLMIRFSGGNKFFSIVISNSMLEQNDGKKRKKNDRNHGHGVPKIKNVLEKYDGRVEVEKEQKQLIVTIYLPI